MKIKRFGVSLEENILNTLDELVKKNNFPNRSQAIRNLVKNQNITENLHKNKIVAGVIIIVYDHHKRELNNKLMNVQHDYHELILSTQHIHIAHNLCLETIAIKGNAKKLVMLANKIIGTKGVKHGRLVMTDID